MFVFIQHFKSGKKPEFMQNECSDDIQAAKKYAVTLLNSSVDVKAVEIYNYVGCANKVENIEWS